MRPFSKLIWAMTAAALVLMLAPAAMAGGNCCPDEGEGQLAELDYGRSDVRWQVFADHVRVRLTVSTPCGVFDRVYDKGELPSFDIAELGEDNPNGQYSWQIRIEQPVDPSVQKALMEARQSGDDRIVGELRRKGLLPSGPFIQTGEFMVIENAIVPPGEIEKGQGLRVSDASSGPNESAGFESASARRITAADIVHNDDVIIHNSLCVGFDCINNEVFNADTIRLKENNLRIHVEDTSSAAGFPTTDWRLEFNSQSSGGQSYFRVIDASTSRNIMTLEGSAPSNSLVVDNGGRVGMGTANPVVELHVVDGDTPTLRLDQDTSSGFGAQVWDVAGNETNFFVRDVNAGSTLPFRIFPGSSSSSLVIRESDVGIGTASPTASLHVRKTDGSANLLVEEASSTVASRTLITARNNGQTRFQIHNTNATVPAAGGYFFAHFDNGTFVIRPNGGGQGFFMDSTGDITTEADLTVNGTFSNPSSRTLKQGFEPVDSQGMLARLVELPIAEWSYIADEDRRRHVGPTAEDFLGAFGLGSDGKYIFPLDVQGVTIAAVQGLYQQVQAKDARIDSLEQQIAELQGVVAAMAGNR